MAIETHIAANRQNVKKSTGPRTVEGKRRSSLNSLTSGLSANDLREHFSAADRTIYDDFIKRHANAFSPKGLEEEWLAKKIAQKMFLLDRVDDLNLLMICEPLQPNGSHSTAYAWTKPLASISLYKVRMRREFERDYAQLEAMQASRKRIEESWTTLS